MFIAVGFPSSARETGAEVLYAGLSREEMLKACETASAGKRFATIGKLFRPIFQKHSQAPVVLVKTDCSVAHNAGLTAQRASTAAGDLAEMAALKGATAKAAAAQAEARNAQAALDRAAGSVKICAEALSRDPGNGVLKARAAQYDLELEAAKKKLDFETAYAAAAGKALEALSAKAGEEEKAEEEPAGGEGETQSLKKKKK